MPEFILDHGSVEGSRTFASLDEFTQAYVEAMFFTSTGTRDDEDLEHASFDELAPETLAKIIHDCELFQKDNADLIDHEWSQAGHDFWLTRNHHGAGFWDGDWEEPDATALTHASHGYSAIDLYRGDDGRLYLM